MNKITKIICLALALCALCLGSVACEKKTTGKAFYDVESSNTGSGTDIRMLFVEREIDSMKVEDFVPSSEQSDYVLIKIKDHGSIVVLLRGDVAPKSVSNFKKLVSEKFYDGTIFHRVIENFMIQGGGNTVTYNDEGHSVLNEKESAQIFGEFDSNNFMNNLTHVRGVISMARTSDKNSASCQFFIVHQDSAHLNGEYASFGYVLAGMDVVDAVATCQTVGDDLPLEDVIIESVSFVEPK